MAKRKKISQLDPKADLASSDLLPIVDTESTRLRTKRTTVQDIATFVAAVPNSARGVASGVATLDAQGKVPLTQLPARALTEAFVVTSQLAMLGLSAQPGDLAIREDTQQTFVLMGGSPNMLANWQMLLTPSSPNNWQISELDDKPILAAADLLPVFDTEAAQPHTKKTTLQAVAAFIDAVPSSQKGAPGGISTLDSQGKVPLAQLPGRALTEIFVVGSQAAMLSVTADRGDLAIREDTRQTFILMGGTANVLGNWQEILAPRFAIEELTNVVVASAPPSRAALVFDPVTGTWRPAALDRITDGNLNSITLKYSDVVGNVPGALNPGEVFLNRADGLLYYSHTGGQVQVLNTPSLAGPPGPTGPAGPPGPQGAIPESFELVAKNIRSYPAVLGYSNGVLATITYNIPTGAVVKTFNYTDGLLTSIVLSGATPAGIALTKLLTYSDGVLVNVSYS
jgi:hypothetical protein